MYPNSLVFLSSENNSSFSSFSIQYEIGLNPLLPLEREHIFNFGSKSYISRLFHLWSYPNKIFKVSACDRCLSFSKYGTKYQQTVVPLIFYRCF